MLFEAWISRDFVITNPCVYRSFRSLEITNPITNGKFLDIRR